MNLIYTKRKDIPDKDNFCLIEWDYSMMGYTGTFGGRMLFQVITIHDGHLSKIEKRFLNQAIEEMDGNARWKQIGEFDEEELFSVSFLSMGKEYAEKYYSYHSLHRCQEEAEKIASELLKKIMVGS